MTEKKKGPLEKTRVELAEDLGGKDKLGRIDNPIHEVVEACSVTEGKDKCKKAVDDFLNNKSTLSEMAETVTEASSNDETVMDRVDEIIEEVESGQDDILDITYQEALEKTEGQDCPDCNVNVPLEIAHKVCNMDGDKGACDNAKVLEGEQTLGEYFDELESNTDGDTRETIRNSKKELIKVLNGEYDE